ncbi:hypothetical protein [Streptomyces murinus]|uniref:hypothetical protein n=1 Tax=Streptomyces murinus TaxID=33900 RepID=UPI003F461A6D
MEAHLVGDDRTDLAALLPGRRRPRQRDVAEARREIDAVLPTLADAADHALLTQLPPGHAGLFGCTGPG